MVMLRFFLVLSCFLFPVSQSASTKEKHTKVLILGAGIAGVSAAKTLHKNGIDDFILLEGTDRIGGRMLNLSWHGTTIEQGANWIQGTQHNPIFKLAQEYGLKGHFENRSYLIRNETGYNTTLRGRLPELKRVESRIDEIIANRRKRKEEDISVRVALRLAGWLPMTPEEMATEYFEYDFEFAIPPKYVSARVWLNTNGTIKSDHGKQFFVTDPRGYVYVVERLANEFLTDHDPRLQLNRRVETIKWNNHCVSVQTDTGDVYTADYALLTFSIGVLKSGLVQFEPQLPLWKQEALFKLNMVIYTKIFLKFEKMFWDQEEYIMYASQRRGYYTIWQNLQADSRLPEGTNILMMTVTGEESARLEYQSNKETQSEIMQVLRKVYGPDIPNPIDIFYPRWGLNEFFLGSWANVPIGITSEDFVKLRAPTGRLFYAGEATSELYNGYVHGAYLSGIARGEDIANCINTGCCAD